VDNVLLLHRSALAAHLDATLDGGFSGRLLLRWAALLHDVGKPRTQTSDETGRIRFLGHDDAGAALATTILNRLRFSGEAVRRVRDTVGGHMRPLYLANDGRTPSRRTVYRYYRALHAAGIDVSLLSLADHLATYDGPGPDESWAALLGVVGTLLDTYFNGYSETVAPPRLLNGLEVMDLLGIEPGRELGRLLAELEEAQAAGEVTTHEAAVDFLRRLAAPK
jgi:putative nucleotidyltransferase with HDIG domain